MLSALTRFKLKIHTETALAQRLQHVEITSPCTIMHSTLLESNLCKLQTKPGHDVEKRHL